MISFLLLPPAAFEKFSLFFIKIRQPVLLFLFKLLFQLFIVLALPVIIQAGRHMVDHIFHSIGQLKVMVYLEILSRTVNMILEKQVKKLLLLLITKVNLMHIILYQMMQK